MFRSIVFTAITSLFIALFLPLKGFAEEAIIVHPSNTSTIETKDVEKIYLGKAKAFSNGVKALPLNQGEGTAIRAHFSTTVLNKSNDQFKAYWAKLMFTGKGTQPEEVADDAAVISLVANNPSYIGYVSDASALDGSVKVLQNF